MRLISKMPTLAAIAYKTAIGELPYARTSKNMLRIANLCFQVLHLHGTGSLSYRFACCFTDTLPGDSRASQLSDPTHAPSSFFFETIGF